MSDTITGKLSIVTGGTRGIGFQTALALLRAGHRVVITGRERARCEAAASELRAQSAGAEVEYVLADFGSIHSTRAAAAILAARCPEIDVLVNNAGVLATEEGFSEDGVETNFAVNAFAPYLLTRALQGNLKAGARVINVSGGFPIYGLPRPDRNPAHGFRGFVTYSRSKRGLEALSLELAQELQPRGVSLVIVSPGFAATEMSRGITLGSVPLWFWLVFPIFALIRRSDSATSSERAARVCAWAATEAQLPPDNAFSAPGKALTLHQSVRDSAQRAQFRGYVDAVDRRA